MATFLTEMDGIENSNGIIVVGATNRPEMIDDALLRPGRFDKLMYIFVFAFILVIFLHQILKLERIFSVYIQSIFTQMIHLTLMS